MNARQKAKKYKKAYEDLVKQPVRYYVVTHPVDTLHFKKKYPMEWAFNQEAFRNKVKNDMKNELMDKIEPYIYWRLDEDICNDCYLLDFQIKVVSRDEVIHSLANGVQTDILWCTQHNPLIEVTHG